MQSGGRSCIGGGDNIRGRTGEFSLVLGPIRMEIVLEEISQLVRRNGLCRIHYHFCIGENPTSACEHDDITGPNVIIPASVNGSLIDIHFRLIISVI